MWEWGRVAIASTFFYIQLKMADTKDKKVRTETVLVKLDCSDAKTRSFDVPINLKMNKADGFVVMQIVSVTSSANEWQVFSLRTNLVPDDSIGVCGSFHSTGTNAVFKFPGGKYVHGSYKFVVEDVATTPTTTHVVIGVLLEFFSYS